MEGKEDFELSILYRENIAMLAHHDYELVFYSAAELSKGKYIKAIDSSSKDGLDFYIIKLTVQGSQLLDSIRNEKAWKDILSKMLEKGGEFSLSLLTFAIELCKNSRV